MNYFSLGMRNILRNPRRSFATGLAIAIGFAAINLFSGYIYNVYAGLSEQSIKGERLGHLTISKKGALKGGALEPEKYIFTGKEIKGVVDIVSKKNEVEHVALRLSVSGIISNGNVSTVFIGEGMSPTDVDILSGDYRGNRGPLLSTNNPSSGAIASDLASMLNLDTGGFAVLVAPTVNGQTNAVDLDIGTIFNTGNAGTNDKYLIVPLEIIQQLLATDGADRIIILLKNGEELEAVKSSLISSFKSFGYDLEVRSWTELSAFYTQVKNLFDMIFAFIFTIVLIIVLMSIINTMSMSVMERTREIGTMRAIGMNASDIIMLFTIEGLLLVLMGSIFGFILTSGIRVVINSLDFSYVPPNSSEAVPLLIDFVPLLLMQSFFLLAVVATIAAMLPARKAAKMHVVDALSHV